MVRGLVAGAAPLLALALAGTFADGQERPPFHGEAFVNTVEVPVRVQSRSGEPVTGLVRDDFEILEDGVVQAITNFVEVEGSERTEVVERPRFRTTTTSPDSRDLVYFFDLLLSQKEDKRRAVEALRGRYGGGVPAGERVSIVTFSSRGLVPLVERSASIPDIMGGLDRVDAARAEGLMWGMSVANPDDLVAGISDRRARGQARRSLTRVSRRQYFDELRARMEKVGAALEATMARYAEGDARRVLVVFSPGLPRSAWTPFDGSLESMTDEPSFLRHGLWYANAEDAADLGFTMYFVDSSTARFAADAGVEKGLTVSSGGSDDGGDDADAGDEALGDEFDHTRRDILAAAAELTGGRALHASDVSRALERVNADVGDYYSLAYQPEHAGDGREHRITVRLPGHPELRVEHRRSYVDRPLARRDEQELAAQMLFRKDANPAGIKVVVGEASRRLRVGARGMRRVQVPIEVQIPYHALTLIADGAEWAGVVRIAFMAEDRSGAVSPVASHQVVVRVPAARLDDARRDGVFSFATTLVTEGGRQTLHVAVTDLVEGRHSFLSIPLSL